jgi:hypothetical protein
MVEQRGELPLRGTLGYRNGPPPLARARERGLDTDIDGRIRAIAEMERQRFEQTLAARLEEERELWRAVLAGVIARMRDEAPLGPQGPPGPVGKLSKVRVWKSGKVAYEDQVFTHLGACYQALRDTGQEPGGTDWVEIARAGRDGVLPRLCGTYDSKNTYERFDIVELSGSSFIARKDDPGECPGANWQLLVSAGKDGGRGERGEVGPRGMTGERGPKGEPGAAIIGWEIDAASYTVVPLMSDGQQGPVLQLREIFKRFVVDAR